ncbi:MAG TPA: aminoacyl--tRNA ligase-related protein [Candidatus Paceibacterota bacterium]
MRQSQLFTKTRREAPSDEVSKNAILLTRAGFVHKEMAGVYSYLPLGLRVIKKIENIIREEMNAIGGQELELTALQDKTLWEKTGRWSDEVVDVWFKTRDDNYGLGFTHEEPLTQIMTEHISSYRDLPVYVYQFQTKFRNEARAKSGIMRGREFLMKDLYSFSRSVEEHEEFYNKVKGAYEKVFERAGIGDRTYFTTASGGSFGDKSHEFQCVSEAGEDTIYITDKNKKEAINKEIGSEGVEKKAVEVGNIFPLGTKFSEALELCFKDEEGNKKPVIMGSYGIGVSRLMGVIAEVFSDERGLIWNKEVSPFQVHLLAMSRTVLDKAEEVYKKLVSSGVEVLYDDRDLRAGEKFADADLIGIPTRVVVGNKYKESGKLEVKERTEEESKEMTLEEFNAKFI